MAEAAAWSGGAVGIGERERGGAATPNECESPAGSAPSIKRIFSHIQEW